MIRGQLFRQLGVKGVCSPGRVPNTWFGSFLSPASRDKGPTPPTDRTPDLSVHMAYLHSLEVLHARTQGKTSPKPTPRTLTRHLACTHTCLEASVCLSHQEAPPDTRSPSATPGSVGHTCPTCPPLAPKPFGGRRASQKSIYPPGKTPEPNAVI